MMQDAYGGYVSCESCSWLALESQGFRFYASTFLLFLRSELYGRMTLALASSQLPSALCKYIKKDTASNPFLRVVNHSRNFSIELLHNNTLLDNSKHMIVIKFPTSTP